MNGYELAARQEKAALLIETLKAANAPSAMAAQMSDEQWLLAAQVAGVKPPSWPDPYFADKRVEKEARNIQVQHDDYAQAQAFWRRGGIGIVALLFLGLVWMVTR